MFSSCIQSVTVMIVLFHTISIVPSTTSAFVVVHGSKTSVTSKWSGNFPTQLYSETSSTATDVQDTPLLLPNFNNKDEYLSYMESAASLPQGFATGTADGTFISVEAPNMGPLPIRATIIHVTNGPTNSWAAVYTKNKVTLEKNKCNNHCCLSTEKYSN
jgi:hypothetical protein